VTKAHVIPANAGIQSSTLREALRIDVVCFARVFSLDPGIRRDDDEAQYFIKPGWNGWL